MLNWKWDNDELNASWNDLTFRIIYEASNYNLFVRRNGERIHASFDTTLARAIRKAESFLNANQTDDFIWQINGDMFETCKNGQRFRIKKLSSQRPPSTSCYNLANPVYVCDYYQGGNWWLRIGLGSFCQVLGAVEQHYRAYLQRVESHDIVTETNQE